MKENFSENEWSLIQDILQNGRNISWFELAQKYQIKLGLNYTQRRKGANDIWRKFIRLTNKNNVDLTTIKQTLNKDGEIIFETKKLIQESPELNEGVLAGKKIKKITTNPNGKPWVTYVEDEKLEEQIDKEEIFNSIKQLLKNEEVENTKVFNFSDNSFFSEKDLLVYTSDKHIGAKTQSNSIYNNEYNAEEFSNRMMKIASKIASLGSMDNLIIFDLGDALDGFNAQTTRGGHTLPQNMNNKEQFETYLKVHAEFFNHILNNKNSYNKIYYVCAANNNHGGDVDYMAMKAFELYLNKINPFINVIVTDKFISHLEIKKGNELMYTILFTHGKDDSDMKYGLPLVLNDKTENYINNYIDYHQIDTRKPIHFIKGDLHQSATQYGKRFRYKNVGSIYGSSKWIHTNFGNTKPICDMDVIERDSINEIRLFL